ncbi:MAG: glycosyltransferase [Anaeromyxobacteraceae bacterium]
MRVSIALATYNGQRFLAEQLESFRAQTAPPAELVVTDDGSTDRTLAILEEFASSAPFPVRVVRNEQRLGPSENFFKAASLCREPWIAFADQDDVWLPRKLEVVARIQGMHPATLYVAHRAEIVDAALRPTGKLLQVPRFNRLRLVKPRRERIWLPPLGFTATFDGRLVREMPVRDRPIETHDRWVFVLASTLGVVAYVPDVLALYRRHDANTSQFTERPPLNEELTDSRFEDQFRHQAETITRIADYLERNSSSASICEPRDVREAAEMYRRQAKWLYGRALLCSRTSPGSLRAGRVAAMILGGAYTSHRRGGLGWRAGLKDLLRVGAAALPSKAFR